MGQGYVPALRHHWLTRIYDPVVRITTRERTFRHRLLAAARLTSCRTLLDVGCGTGTLAVEACRSHEGLRVVGLDPDPQALEIARRKADAARVDVQYVEGFSHRLPFGPDSFERVTSTLMFHHLDAAAKQRTADEVFRVLTPAGEFHVADWGVPANVVMRVLFTPVQILDGFTNTDDNLRGAVARAMTRAGFVEVAETGRIATPLGTLSGYRAVKPG